MKATDALGPTAAAAPLRRLRKPVPRPVIDPQRCTGCGRCVAACELHLLSLEAVRWEKFATLNEPQRCTGCGLCVPRCPFEAITLRRPTGHAS